MRAFTQSLLLPKLFMLVSVFCRDVSLAPRGEFFHDRNQHPFILRVHSISLLFLPLHCHSCLLSSAPSCLHIVWSKATNCSLIACSLAAFSLTSLHSCFHWCLFSAHLWSQDDFRWAQKNKMQLKDLKGHKSFYCWQGGAGEQGASPQLKWLTYRSDSVFLLSRTQCFGSINYCVLPLSQWISVLSLFCLRLFNANHRQQNCRLAS